MPIRSFVLPDDISTLIDLIPPSFEYPENPEWSVQADEMQSLTDSLSSIRRIWPVLRMMQVISPSLKDLLLGYIWEEDGKPVGLTNVLRQGSTNTWLIGNVAVLPEYRRRGIARKLVEASMDLACKRGAKAIILDVISGNVPAQTLYERLGFEHYSGQSQMHYEQSAPPTELPIPAGYTLEQRKLSDWKPRYVLALRVTPENVQKYAPVEKGRFRQPAALMLFLPVIMVAMGTRVQAYQVRDANGQVVATGGFNARKRAGGLNMINLTIDPAHPAVGPYFLRFLANRVLEAAPGRRIEYSPHHWQTDLIQAAEDAGFTKQLDMNSMGYVVK